MGMLVQKLHLDLLKDIRYWPVAAIGALVLYFIYYNLKIFYLEKKFNAKQGKYLPGSNFFCSRNPITMLQNKQNGTLLQLIWELFDLAGKNWRITIGFSELFVTSDPENIKAVLATQFNDFVLGFRNSHFKPLLGNGVFTLDGAGWKHSRAMLRPNFTREKIAHVQTLEDHLQVLVKHVRRHAGEKFDIQELFYMFTVDTSTEFLFGTSVDGLRNDFIGEEPRNSFKGRDTFYDSFNFSQTYCATRAWLQNWYWVLNSSEFHTNNKLVHEFANFYVDQALKATPEEIEERSRGGYVFLYELVKHNRDPVNLRDQLLNIMIAGRDTTAGLLSFTMYELARHPEIWEKLKAEIATNFGCGEESRLEDITFESLKKCEYLKCVINETLRLYPSVPVNYRVATRNTTLPRGGGENGLSPVVIEKGRVIGYVISATHRNPEFYGKTANDYIPERWLDKSLKPGWAYLPFNGGPRICLGQQFALTEASYVIARLVQMFPNLRSADTTGNYPPRLSSHLTVSLTDGCWINLD